MRVFIILAAACLLLASVYAAVRTNFALSAAKAELQSLEQDLHDANQENGARRTDYDHLVKHAVPAAIEGHTRLLTTLAREYRPGAEWTSTAVNPIVSHGFYQRTLADFVGHAPHQEAFPELVASASYRLGQLHFLVGDHTAAIRALRKSIELAQSIQDPATAGLASNTLGCVNTSLGNFQAAIENFQQAHEQLQGRRDHAVPDALCMRNLGLVQRAIGGDGTREVHAAIEQLSTLASDRKFNYTNELLIDAKMSLCEMYWSQREHELARVQCQQSHEALLTQLKLTRNFGRPGTTRNRFLDAIGLADHDLQQLTPPADNTPHDEPDTSGEIGSAGGMGDGCGWQWQPLFDLTTELVSSDLSVTATMSAEFDRQNGLLLAWGMYDWTPEVVVEIAKHAWNRCRLTIVADNFESLKEAQDALDEAGIPLSSVTFDVCAHDAFWFRDGGPIVGKSPCGKAIWFDAHLTRHDLPNRLVTDALPRLIADDWQARVARTPLHIEGGMLLSNGSGLTVCTNSVLTTNRRYGFSHDFILQELKRVTGAKELALVDSMIDEATGHLDLFMTFVDRQTAVVGDFSDPSEPNAARLDEIADSLAKLSVDGKPLNVVRVPMPPRRKSEFEGTRTGMFQSFTNVVYLNGLLLVPSYQGEAERFEKAVYDVYASLLPDWEIQFVDCTRPSLFGGALHCLVANLGDTPMRQDSEDR